MVSPRGQRLCRRPRCSGGTLQSLCGEHRRPARLGDVLKSATLPNGHWVPIYRPHDPTAAFDAVFLAHHRLRKFQGRFAREWKGKRFQEFAAYLAKRALAAHPNAEAVRVRLERKQSLPPEAVRSGLKAKGSYEVTHVFDRPGLP